MGTSRHRIRTKKAEIARYWLDTSTGLERLPDACGCDAVRHDVSAEGWDGWAARGYVTDATLEAVMVESVCRVVAQRDGSSVACA